MQMYRYIIGVGGMACGSCESHVNNEVRKHFPNIRVKSSHLKNQTIIESKEKLDLKEVEQVIINTHYDFLSIKEEIYEKKSFFQKLFKKK